MPNISILLHRYLFTNNTIAYPITVETETEIPEVLNEKAVEITDRISNKLTGKDFSVKESLSVKRQVERLIKQATDIENLAQAYLGWYVNIIIYIYLF